MVGVDGGCVGGGLWWVCWCLLEAAVVVVVVVGCGCGGC
jgi:hypothetical protein